jgi:hypothetical protein
MNRFHHFVERNVVVNKLQYIVIVIVIKNFYRAYGAYTYGAYTAPK